MRQGLASEARVGEAVRRWLLPQMRAGRFDAPGPGNPHAGLTTAALNSSAHQQVLEAASKGSCLSGAEHFTKWRGATRSGS